MRTAKTIWLKWAQGLLTEKNQHHLQFSPTRRKFLQNTSKSALGFALLPNNIGLASAKNPRIAIVGGGLAGLTCAWQLKKAGLSNVTVYEASNRVGGRTYSVNDFQGDLNCELGGEFFSSGHQYMIQLARELNLKINTSSATNQHLKPFKAYFGKREIPFEDLEASILSFNEKILSDLADLPKMATWEYADQFQHFDQMSVTEYLKKKGADDLCYDFLKKAVTIETGMEANEQSAMNLLQTFQKGLVYHPTSKIKSLQLKDGNQSICKVLAKNMWESLRAEHKLVHLHQHTTWYKLQFKHQGRIKTIEADFVILAVPFSVLRNIESDIHFPERKLQAINELGYGQKGSLLLGFNQKTWREQGYDGLTFSDEPFGYGSDLSPKEKGKNHVLSIKPSGKEAAVFSKMDIADAAVKSLDSFNKIYPGIYESFDGQALKFNWSDNPGFLGSNACYKVGQVSQFGGEEGKSVENLFFAGEHCSHEFKGTMNGAIETGLLAANSILRRVKRQKRKVKP